MEVHYGSGGLHHRNILERRKEVSFKATNSLRLSLHLLSHNLCWYNMDGSRVFTKKMHFALSNTQCMASRQNKFVPKAKVSFMHAAGTEEGLSYHHLPTAFISSSLSLSPHNNLLKWALLPVLAIQHQSLPPLPPSPPSSLLLFPPLHNTTLLAI